MQDSFHQSFMAMMSVPGLAMNSPEIKRQKKKHFFFGWFYIVIKQNAKGKKTTNKIRDKDLCKVTKALIPQIRL